jgi:hypothetical protein
MRNVFIIILFFIIPYSSLHAEQFIGGPIGAWEVSILTGLSLEPLTDSFNFYFPVEIEGSYKVGLLGLWATPFLGIDLKTFTTGLSISDTHFMIGISAGARRFATITLYHDFISASNGNYFIPGFNVIEGTVLLMKHFIRIEGSTGIFIDLTYKYLALSEYSNSHFRKMHSFLISILYTNECRTGLLGGGILPFLSPFFWIDPQKYTDGLLF